MKRKIIPVILILVVAIPLLLWASALIRCEMLTKKYFNVFEQAYTQNTMLDEMEYFKVLKCDGDTAEVYYVSKGMTMGDVLTFENDNGSWKETSWRTVWSTSGSASEVVYPYLWHFVYGGM